MRGARPRIRLSAVAERLRTGAPLHIGLNSCYLAPNGQSRGVLKVRHGQEIGVADKRLTARRPAARRFLQSFS